MVSRHVLVRFAFLSDPNGYIGWVITLGSSFIWKVGLRLNGNPKPWNATRGCC